MENHAAKITANLILINKYKIRQNEEYKDFEHLLDAKFERDYSFSLGVDEDSVFARAEPLYEVPESLQVKFEYSHEYRPFNEIYMDELQLILQMFLSEKFLATLEKDFDEEKLKKIFDTTIQNILDRNPSN